MMTEGESSDVATELVLKKQPQWISCSRILNLMVLIGFMVNYMLRVNFSIEIVDMVPNQKKNVSIEQTANFSTFSLNYTNTTVSWTHSETQNGVKFNWSEYEQNLLLGSFFWGYFLTEMPGGRMAEIFGARPVFGYSMLSASIITLLTPMATKIGFYSILLSRTFLGFALGITWPAIIPLAAKWIPPNERSKFIANMMASGLGAAITLPICGLLISAWGWESVFYITGILGVLWSAMWFNLVYETPADHPKITEYERYYIESQIAKQSSSNNKSIKVPWKKLLTSWPVWAILITHGTNGFCYLTIVNQLPTYMKYLLHFDIKANGLLSSLPYLGRYIMALTVGVIADYLLNSEKITKTMTRKIFTNIGAFTPGVMMVLQAYYGEDQVWSVIIFTIALTMNGAVTGGFMANGLDIAPNFSGTIFGMANTLSSLGGFISSIIVGKLTNNNILAVVYMFGALIFLIFGTSKTLPWNSLLGSEKSNKISLDESEVVKPLTNSASS